MHYQVHNQLQKWNKKKAELKEQAKEDQEEQDDEDDDDDISNDSTATHHQFADMNIMACLLCQRKFKTLQDLQRHQELSELHKASWITYIFWIISDTYLLQ